MHPDRGGHSLDKVKLQLVMCFEGIRSERELIKVAADRLSVQSYLRYELDEGLPDHSPRRGFSTGSGITRPQATRLSGPGDPYHHSGPLTVLQRASSRR